MVLGGCCCTHPFPESDGRWVDLTHGFDQDTVYWPTASGFQHTVDFDGVTAGGWYYRAASFTAAEHGGTHLDAPSHFQEHGLAADEIPLERLMGPAVVVDVTAACAADPDHEITVADLQAHEQAHGRIPPQSIVLLRTGFGDRWPDRATYLGTAERGPEAVALLHFPGLQPAAARWLATERRIDAVGVDTASIDPGQSQRFESHQLLFEHNIPVFENVAHLEQLPPTGAWVIALPMKIVGGTGGPLRIVALLP